MTLWPRRILLLSLLLISSASVTIAQVIRPGGQKNQRTDDKPIYFNASAREVIPPATTPGDKISANSIGNVMTVLFDEAKVSLQTESDPLTATWATTIAVPTNPAGQKLTSYLQQVRGAVTKSADSRVSIVFSLGGKTFVKEYPYGTKSTGDTTLTFVSPIGTRGAERYVATIAILVERRDLKSAVIVDVDSLDVEAKPLAKRKPK